MQEVNKMDTSFCVVYSSYVHSIIFPASLVLFLLECLWLWCTMRSQILLLAVPPISAEEDRLWSIVRANSLDFDAWVALIEETERTAEVCMF